MTEEKNALDEIRRMTREDFEYNSNNGKEKRERDNVSLFLSILGITFNDTELHSPEQSSKTDVSFRGAAFQVKELMNEGYKRTGHIRDAFRSAENAKSLKEVSLVSGCYDTPQPARMIDLVYNEALRRADEEKYVDVKGSLDLLFYVTRTHASLIQDAEVKAYAFSDLGWRSVSCVNTKQAVILSASPSAPSFICNHAAKVFWKQDDSSSLFGDQS